MFTLSGFENKRQGTVKCILIIFTLLRYNHDCKAATSFSCCFYVDNLLIMVLDVIYSR